METLNLLSRNVIKIIIVDDNELFIRVMREFLQNNLNCEIIGEAYNGESFLQLPNISNADIVLMDLQMPKVNGYQSAQRMSIQYPDLKMIAVTMYKESIVRSKLIEFGFKGCVYKTTFFNNIIPAMQQILSGGCFYNENIPIT